MRYYIETSDKRNLRLLQLLQLKGKLCAQLTSESILQMQRGDVCVFSPAKKLLPQDVADFTDGILLFAGNLNSQTAKALKQKGIKHINFMTDGLFACKNAALTAEGALALLIQNTEKSIYQSNILILGMGRCAKAIARLFDRLGLSFSMVTYNEAKYDDGILLAKNCYLKNSFVASLEKFDVVINTIPAKVLEDEIVAKINKNTLIIEIASQPCLDSALAKQAGINYLPAPALPLVFCCESAARVMLEAIEREA